MKTIHVPVSVIPSCLVTACGDTSVPVKTATYGEILAWDGMATMVFDGGRRVGHRHGKEFISRYPTRGLINI